MVSRKWWISLGCAIILLALGSLVGCQDKEAVKDLGPTFGYVTAAQVRALSGW